MVLVPGVGFGDEISRFPIPVINLENIKYIVYKVFREKTTTHAKTVQQQSISKNRLHYLSAALSSIKLSWGWLGACADMLCRRLSRFSR